MRECASWWAVACLTDGRDPSTSLVPRCGRDDRGMFGLAAVGMTRGCGRLAELALSSSNGGEMTGSCGSGAVDDQVRHALADHHAGGVGVGPDAVRHDRGVGDADAFEAVDAPSLIDGGHGVR